MEEGAGGGQGGGGVGGQVGEWKERGLGVCLYLCVCVCARVVGVGGFWKPAAMFSFFVLPAAKNQEASAFPQ